MKKRIISLCLALVMLLGLLPISAMAAVEKGETLTYDFKSFAVDAAEQEWWSGLLAAGDDNTKFIGSASSKRPMSEESLAAYQSMQDYLAEGNWRINENMTEFTNAYHAKRLWINADPEIPWGIAYHSTYHNDSEGNGSIDKSRSDLTLYIEVEKAGYYEMDVSGWFEVLSGNNTQTGTYAGGGYVDIFVNNELAVAKMFFGADDASYAGTKPGGRMELHEGTNTVTIEMTTSAEHKVGARRVIYLSALEFTEILCDHENAETIYASRGKNTHKFWQICNDCERNLTEETVEDCVDEDEDEVCDSCNGPIVFIPDDPRYILIDFKDFADMASRQYWWDDLVSADHKDTRMIGRVRASEVMTETEQEAYAAMQEFLAVNASWKINEELTGLVEGAPKRVFFCTSEDVPWGLAFYPTYLGASDHQSELAFDITVPEGGEGWYNLTLQSYKEESNGKSPTYTSAVACLPGGSYADVLVNSEEIYNEYSFAGSKLNVDSMGAVYLKEGVNTVSFDLVKDYLGKTNNGRRQMLLKSLELKPLDPVEVPEYLSSTVTLKETYLPYDAMLDGVGVQTANDLIAEASVNAAGVVTVTGVTSGETEVYVQKNGETLHTIPVNVQPFTGTLDDLQGNPAKLDFMAFADRAAEQPWWNSLGDGEVRCADTSDSEVLAWLDANTRWNLNEGEIMVNGGNEKYGISAMDGDIELVVDIPAEGLYGVTLEYLQEEEDASIDVAINDTMLYEGLVVSGETAVVKASLGAVTMNRGTNTVQFAVDGEAKLRGVIFTPLGSRQVEVKKNQYVDLNTTYLSFDANAADYSISVSDKAIASATIDADGDLVITGAAEGQTTVTISGENTFTVLVNVVKAGIFQSMGYTLDGLKAVTLEPGSAAEGILSGITTQNTQISEKQLRLESDVYFASSDTAVAVVDQTTGDVTAVGEGQATISAYVLADGVTSGDFATVVVTDDTDLASVEVYAQLDYVGVGNSMQMFVSGLKSSFVSADMDLYPVTWSVDDEEVAVISENGRLTGKKVGAVTVTATASVNGMPISDTMVVEVVENSVLPATDVIVDFTDSRATDAATATIEEDGYEINRELTYEGGSKINFANKYGLNQSCVVDRVLAIDVHVPRSGWYTAEINSAQFTAGGIADIFVDDMFVGIVDFYAGRNGLQYEGGGQRNTIWLEAGTHTFKLVCTYAGGFYVGRLCLRATSDPSNAAIIMEGKTQLLTGETADIALDIQPANNRGEFTLKNVAEAPAYTNYYILSSSAPEVVSVAGSTIKAVSAGTAVITAQCEINFEQVLRTMEVEVFDGVISTVELTADDTTVKPGAAPVQLQLTAKGISGETIAVPEGVTVSYESENEAVATVDETGLVKFAGAEGSAKITAAVNEDGREIMAEIWITVTSGKTQPTLYTYEERANAQENVLKYSWAWEMKEETIALADFVVDHLDEFYDLYIHDTFPRSTGAGLKEDDNYLNCRYCGVYLGSKWGVYPWIIDPINNPWKITCPACKRDFPSNDFGAYYESGLDENGIFSYDLADKSLLVNELYPEMGPGWGVDDGKGFVTKNPNTGKEETHVYIAHYMFAVFMDFSKYSLNFILPALQNAYLYTGDETYGSAGAILTNRLADIYPGYDIKNHPSIYKCADGNSYCGKFVGSIWEATENTHVLAQAADAFWPAMDNPDVIEYLRARAPYEGKDPEMITPEYIRNNVDEGILLEIKKATETGYSSGNFGMHQAGMVYAAVALDRLPETAEMIDWTFRYGLSQTVNDERQVTGGSVLYNLVDLVDRDGFGNEGSAMYNALWYTNLAEVADALSGYTRVEGADLWANPKFVNMVGGMMKLTMCGTTLPATGESNNVQYNNHGMDVESMLTGFINSGNRDLAVAIFAANGNTTEGIHGSIFTKDPEGGLRAKIQQIVNEDGKFDFSESNMMGGLGFAVLREGPATLLKGVNEAEFSDWWMQFGITGGTHSNLDSLNIGLDAFGLNVSPDLGYPTTVATTDPERMQWVTSTSSHNTVIVNDRAQSKVSTNSFPLHFDDAGAVKLIDAEAPGAYADADIYRRTLVSVDNGEGVSYAVDFFRVLGGTEHVYSFHAASTTNPTVDGLDMVHQAMGTYAGPNIPFGFYQSNPNSTDAAANVGNGYSWLNDVYRDDTPENTFSIDWAIEDFHHRLATTSGIRLKLTMLSDEPMAEVALANGRTPQNKTNPSHLEYAMIRRSGSSDMDTLFTSVIEPYQFNSYIAKSELVDVQLVEGKENVTDRVAAIKVTLKNGREDYIVYATNTDCVYEVAGKFLFQGFAGVVSYTDGKLTYAYGNEAKQVAGIVESDMPAITGKVVDFTKELSDNYYMTVETDQAVTAADFEGRYIYVNNDKAENGAYRIYGAEVKGKTVVLDLYTQDMIRNYVDATNLDSGFVYNIAEGQTFTIPMSASFNVGDLFSYTTDQIVKTGSKLTLTTGVVGSGVTYEAEGLPGAAKFNTKDGTITWTTSRTQTGRYPITIKAVDADGDVLGTMSFNIYVVSYTGSTYDAASCAHTKAVSYNVTDEEGNVIAVETVCPACGTITKKAVGEDTEIEKFDIAGSNMTLGNELKLNFMVKTADLVSGTYTAKITHKGETTEQTFAKYNGTYSYVSHSVSAKQMADEITVEVYDENGNAVSNVYTDSVRSYAMRALAASNETDETKTLVVDMLNYGAAAQNYFRYNTTDLANELLSEAQQALATGEVSCTDGRVKGANYYGSNLSLEEKILLNLYFEGCKDDMTAKITYTDHKGVAKTAEAGLEAHSSSTMKVVVDEIVLADAFSPVTVTVYNADGTVHGTATDSVESYVARSGDDALYSSIMKFASSARAYFS